MNDRDALLANVLEHPKSDLPRLVFADFIEDQGDFERAEYIRLGCEMFSMEGKHPCCVRNKEPCEDPNCAFCPLHKRSDQVYRRDWFPDVPGDVIMHVIRGWVAEVQADWDWLNGVACWTCRGNGNNAMYHIRNGIWSSTICKGCWGKGYRAANLAELIKTQPIEFVWARDKEPVEIGGVWNWMENPPEPESTWFIPRHIWSLIDLPGAPDFEDRAKCATSRELAHRALSDAMLKNAKAINHNGEQRCPTSP